MLKIRKKDGLKNDFNNFYVDVFKKAAVQQGFVERWRILYFGVRCCDIQGGDEMMRKCPIVLACAKKEQPERPKWAAPAVIFKID